MSLFTTKGYKIACLLFFWILFLTFVVWEYYGISTTTVYETIKHQQPLDFLNISYFNYAKRQENLNMTMHSSDSIISKYSIVQEDLPFCRENITSKAIIFYWFLSFIKVIDIIIEKNTEKHIICL